MTPWGDLTSGEVPQATQNIQLYREIEPGDSQEGKTDKDIPRSGISVQADWSPASGAG